MKRYDDLVSIPELNDTEAKTKDKDNFKSRNLSLIPISHTGNLNNTIINESLIKLDMSGKKFGKSNKKRVIKIKSSIFGKVNLDKRETIDESRLTNNFGINNISPQSYLKSMMYTSYLSPSSQSFYRKPNSRLESINQSL